MLVSPYIIQKLEYAKTKRCIQLNDKESVVRTAKLEVAKYSSFKDHSFSPKNYVGSKSDKNNFLILLII